MTNVLLVLYDDPVDGMPQSYPRDAIPKIERYHDGQTTPTPKRIDFTQGELLGSVAGELGLRGFVEERGHQVVVTSDKDGPESGFERELPHAEIVGFSVPAPEPERLGLTPFALTTFILTDGDAANGDQPECLAAMHRSSCEQTPER
jgi:hypothetical protein